VSLRERVDAVAGKSLFNEATNAPRDTFVQVEFVRSISGFRAVISSRGSRHGTRSLDDVGPDCTSLADAVSITLAILLDPSSALAESDPPPMSPPPAVLPAPAPPRVDSAPTSRRSKKLETTPEPLRFDVEASMGASVAVLKSIVPLAEAGGRARIGQVVALGAGGGVVFPERIAFGGGTIDLSLTYGYVRGCANLLPGRRTMLEACFEPMLGALRGSGNDYDAPDVGWVFWSAAAALVQVYGPISESLLWSLRARVLAPFARHGFTIVQNGLPKEAFRVSGIGGSLAFGLDVEL
jgi:hypothetical protein